ncbi:MAG: NAD(P)-dependent glycerol-3-phosphate dehydrogenase [Eubacterium sp.]|nr:NAD(P)-dependent glycerol-3-phosphate dehydrogenase [Eubacterium sp.]
MSKVGVLGAGSWGIALATVLAANGHDVKVWSIMEDEVEMLRTHHEHQTKLPGVKLADNITYTTKIEEAIVGKEMVVFAVPSTFIRSTAKSAAPYVEQGQLLVNVAKGIEESTLMPMVDIIEQEIPKAVVAVLSGPSHAEEVGRGLPTTVVAGAKKKSTAEKIQTYFMNQVFRVYTSPDVLGLELGGSLKNVIALAAGMADGMGFGDNTKAALITRGISEITQLGLKMGAKAETLSGLSGIGDLIVTCASVHSRNRKAGMLIGQGKTRQEAMDEVKMVVEGVYSAKAAALLGKKYGVELPITEEVNRVLFEDVPAKEGVQNLMMRERKAESEKLAWEQE